MEPQNTNHLAADSICPPLKKDLLRIYSMFFCPYAQITRIVLNAKKVKYETVNINLVDKPDWFLEIYPLAKVPALQLNDKIMYESMVTCDYLDELYPNPPLYPTDPWAKGVDRDLIEVFETKVARFVYKILVNLHDEGEIRSIEESLNEGFDFFETELRKRGKTFFFGGRPGMLDYAIFPWFERLVIMKTLYTDSRILNKESFPKLTEYYADMLKDPAAKSTVANFGDHVHFLKTKLEGNTDYDGGSNGDVVLLSN